MLVTWHHESCLDGSGGCEIIVDTHVVYIYIYISRSCGPKLLYG